MLLAIEVVVVAVVPLSNANQWVEEAAASRTCIRVHRFFYTVTKKGAKRSCPLEKLPYKKWRIPLFILNYLFRHSYGFYTAYMRAKCFSLPKG